MFLDFVPVEFRGMSILTALMFMFIFATSGSYFWWDRREHRRINHRVDGVDDSTTLLFSKLESSKEDISEMKSHMAGIHEAVEWIKHYMEKK